MRYRFLVIALFPLSLAAQENKRPVPDPPKSPNVAAMERYGNFSVDMFRGMPDINIPLYEIKTRHHTVPITLSYHASGIKVTDVASWAGLGWSVNAGGFIGHKVKGLDDGLPMSYFRSDYYLRKPNEIDYSSADGYAYLLRVMDGFMDNEPDIFSYKLPGKYGHFFWPGYAQPAVTVPYDPVQISRTMDPNAISEIVHLQMTDEAGKRYVFGNTNGEPIFESSVASRGSQTNAFRSAWPLTTINSADNTDSVLFRYHPYESMNLFTEIEDYITLKGNIQQWGAGCGATQSITPGGLEVTYVAGQRLMKEILFDNGKVEFVLSATNRSDLPARSLERINVYAVEKGVMKLIRTIQFHHSYYNGPQPRLRLDSITIMSASTTEKMVYRFAYQTSDVVPLNSRSKDYWGYYNGQSNDNLIPGTYTWFPYGSRIAISGHPDARKPSASHVQMGLLRRVQFPTGGYTLFNYEPHQYRNGVSDPMPGGGVRIKSIYSFPQEGSQPLVKTYTYGMVPGDESGNGVLNSILPISFNFREARHEVWGMNESGLSAPICEYTTHTYSSNPTVDNNDYDGTMVYYPFVTEYLGTPGNTTGKITYQYSYVADQLIATLPEFMPGTLTAHWKRGHLERQQEFKQTSPVTFELKKDIIHGYEVMNESTFPDVGFLVAERFKRTGTVPENVQRGLGGWQTPFVYTFYSLKTGAYKLVSTTEKIYESGLSMENITQYTYNGYMQPSQITKTNSKGESTFQVFRYANQYATGNAGNDAALGIKKLLDLNILSVPIETVQGINKPAGPAVTGGKISTFFPNKPVLREEYQMETAAPLTNYTFTAIEQSGNFIPSSVYKRRLTFSAHDVYNNPVEYYTDDADLRHTFLWGYKGTRMIARADQATPNQIAYTSFEDANGGNWQYSEAAVKILPAATVSGQYAFDFTGGYTISMSIAGGTYLVTYWSATACSVNGTAPVSVGPANAKGLKLHTHQVTNVSGQPIYLTSTNAKIDELRLMPRNAVVNTVAYHSSGQISTEINERHHVTNYEFDGLQRLKLVRDNDNRILRQHAYEFDNSGGLSPTLPVTYYNGRLSVTLQRNNCPATDYGTEVTYTVPARTFMSFVSQAAADTEASNDITQNSQNYVNATGECRPKTEVVWQPYGLYCQEAQDYGPEPNLGSYSVTEIYTESGTDNITKFKITRSAEFYYGAEVKANIHFAGGGYSDMPVTVVFARGELEKTGTIMMSPQQTSYRNGMSLASLKRIPYTYQTGMKVYGMRRKKIGGEVVLVEANRPNGGEGPFWPPFSGGLPCDIPTTTGPNVFLSAEITGFFVKTCTGGQSATGVYYTLQGGAIHSIVSQADADAQARGIWLTNGQQQANLATCR